MRRSGARAVHVEIDDDGDNNADSRRQTRRADEPLHFVNDRGNGKAGGKPVHGKNDGHHPKNNRRQSLHGQNGDNDTGRAATASRFPSAAATRFAGNRRG